MGLTAKDKGGEGFAPIEEGMHHAICYGVYDLGTHYDEKFSKSVHKVLIQWELPDERIDIEKDGIMKNLPRAISNKYTLSLHKKAILRRDLEAWRGKTFTETELEGFDITKLLGVNCLLQVLHTKKDDKVYANIKSIVPLMKETEKKAPENSLKYFSFEERESHIPDGTPDWIIDIIKASNEWDEGINEQHDTPYDDAPPLGDNDQIPF